MRIEGYEKLYLGLEVEAECKRSQWIVSVQLSIRMWSWRGKSTGPGIEKEVSLKLKLVRNRGL